MRPVNLTTFLALSLSVCAACKGPPSELEPAQKDPTPNTTPTNAPKNSEPPSSPGAATGPAGKKGGDPHDGSFTLAEATKDLKGNGPIVAKIETSKGTLQCKLLDDKAPLTVANFIGLATGKRAWKDPSGQWVNKPAYDGTGFHRIIKGFMIQGGDARGTGSGEPGYVVKDEVWDGAKHDRAGLLCMANRGPDTNGAQFFVTDAAAPHLDRSYTIFGECAPVEVVHDIANVPVAGERPQSPVTIKSVTITRDEKKK
jgi:peptidyl-prolyl cis-trans isomerase A (cyclophilin A)